MGKTGSRGSSELTTVNATAAAVDIGSKMHVAAVDLACSDDPVRTLEPLRKICMIWRTAFRSCGVTTVVRGIDRGLWIPAYEFSNSAASKSSW